MAKPKLTLEKKPNGLKHNWKRVFNMDAELNGLMEKAIARLVEGDYESTNQNNFIRQAIRAYSMQVLNAKKIGRTFSTR